MGTLALRKGLLLNPSHCLSTLISSTRMLARSPDLAPLYPQVGYDQGSVYGSALMVAAANAPGNIVSLFLIDHPSIGRKKLYIGSMVLASLLALCMGVSQTQVKYTSFYATLVIYSQFRVR